MRHIIFEFITGGGLAGSELPGSLAHEGDIMVRALVHDLKRRQDDTVVLCRDKRLATVDDDIDYVVIADEPHTTIQQALLANDLVWLIAPESNGCLVDWVTWFQAQPTTLLLSSLDCITTCTSKYDTIQLLKQHAVPVIEGVRPGGAIPGSDHGWVVKPDTGAGAEEVMVFKQQQSLDAYLDNNNDERLIQPYIPGQAMSLSILCHDGSALLLGCNEQEITIEHNRLSLNAVTVNACKDKFAACAVIAKQIAAAMPGLRGYIGVDLVADSDGQLLVVEINPRLTTAYAGLSDSTGINIASLIVDVFQSNSLPEPIIDSVTTTRIPV